jgi:hypothetical protein
MFRGNRGQAEVLEVENVSGIACSSVGRGLSRKMWIHVLLEEFVHQGFLFVSHCVDTVLIISFW